MITGNEPFYPIAYSESDNVAPGVTIRQHFAAMAMQGYLACFAGSLVDPQPEPVAKCSVEFADALISELNKPTTNE